MKIVAAAIYRAGLILSMPPPARHHTVMYKAIYVFGVDMAVQPEEQGFLTDAGQYVDREEACRIARAAGQIIKKTGLDDVLFSEDLW